LKLLKTMLNVSSAQQPEIASRANSSLGIDHDVDFLAESTLDQRKKSTSTAS
jgi:hypothetical protein